MDEKIANKIRTVLFDADGVLFNNEEGITKGVQFALRPFNIYITDLTELRNFIGPPLSVAFKKYHYMNDAQAKKAIEYYRAYFKEIGIHQACLYPQVPEMLEKLKSAGFQLAVASSKPSVFVHTILREHNILSYFDHIIAADLKGTLEKKSDIIAEALRITETPSDEAVMIGDRNYDAQGAQDNGVPFIIAHYGFGEPGEMDGYPSIYSADMPIDIANFLTSL